MIVQETPGAWLSHTHALLLQLERMGFVHPVYALVVPLNPLHWVLGAGLVQNQETPALQPWGELGLAAGGAGRAPATFSPCLYRQR